jgi:hypothetical protein
MLAGKINEAAMLKLTPAQLRAMEWLPSDGDWRTDARRLVGALSSLSLGSTPRLCEGEWGDFGPRGGRMLRWRLTPAGVAAKKEIAAA